MCEAHKNQKKKKKLNAYLQEVKSICLMQVSHKVQPKRNVAENYT